MSNSAPNASADLHVVCGSRYNQFAPADRPVGERPGFFRAEEPVVANHEEDCERWDGLG